MQVSKLLALPRSEPCDEADGYSLSRLETGRLLK